MLKEEDQKYAKIGPLAITIASKALLLKAVASVALKIGRPLSLQAWATDILIKEARKQLGIKDRIN